MALDPTSGKARAPDESVLALMGERARRALGAVLLSLLFAQPLLLAAMLTGGATPAETGAVFALLPVVVVLVWLYRRGHSMAVLVGIVAMLVLAAAALGITYGSIRAVGMMATVVAIVIGGAFFGRIALSATVVAGAIVAAMLIWAQSAGLLRTPDYAVGLSQWIEYVVALSVIALSVWYSRSLLVDAVRRARDGEAWLGSVLRNIPAALITSSMDDGRIHEINTAYERIFGVSRSQVVGRTTRDMQLWVAEADREAFVGRLRQGQRAESMSVRLRRANGEAFDALISAEVIEFEGERRVVSVITDISAVTEAQRAREASEARFQTLFRSNPAALVVVDRLSRQPLLINAAAERMFRVDAQAVLGSHLGDRFWPDPAQRDRFWERVDRDGRVDSFEALQRRDGGEVFDVLISAALSEHLGATQAMIAIVDVSAQKREEAQMLEIARGVSAQIGEAFFQRLVEHLARATASDWVFVAELIDGGARARTVARFIDGAPAPQCEFALAGSPSGLVLARREAIVWDCGVAAQFPCDRSLAVAGIQGYIGAPLIGAGGEPTGIMTMASVRPLERSERLLAVFRIFSARAEAELARLQKEREVTALNASLDQRVRERTAQLEAANSELEAFSYSVSHDLRSPLRGIDGFATLLEQRCSDQLSDEARGWLARVRGSTRRMDLIIDDLLALSRVSRAQLKPVPVDLSRMARSVADELARGQPERRVQWRIAEGLSALADPGLVHIVLVNLLGNAWKYTARTPEPVIDLDEASRSARRVEFRVHDNGAGFDMAHAGRLFQPFARLHGQQEFDGVGVGLATVRRVVERHGGTVRGEGHVGEGATFWFSLPVIDAP